MGFRGKVWGNIAACVFAALLPWQIVAFAFNVSTDTSSNTVNTVDAILNRDQTVANAQKQAEINVANTPILLNQHQETSEVNGRNLHNQGDNDANGVGLLAIAVGTAKVAKGKKINKKCKCGAGTPLIIEGKQLIADGKKSLQASEILGGLSTKAQGYNVILGKGEHGGVGKGDDIIRPVFESDVTGTQEDKEKRNLDSVRVSAASTARGDVQEALAEVQRESGLTPEQFVEGLRQGYSVPFMLEKAPTHVGDHQQFVLFDRLGAPVLAEGEDRSPASSDLTAKLGLTPEGFSQLEKTLPAVVSRSAGEGLMGRAFSKDDMDQATRAYMKAMFTHAGVNPDARRNEATLAETNTAHLEPLAVFEQENLNEKSIFEMVRGQYLKRSAMLKVIMLK